MGVVRLSNAGIRDFQKVDNFLAGNEPFSPFPSFLSSAPLWLDASDASTITESGGSVSQWDNKGTGSNFSQATSADQPTTGVSTQNGLNVIDFDVDSLQQDGTIEEYKFLHDGTTYFFAIAYKYDSAPKFHCVFGTLAASSSQLNGNSFFIDNRNPDNDEFGYNINALNIGQIAFAGQNNFLSSNFEAVSALVDPDAATANRIEYFKNNTQGTNDNTLTGSPGSGNPENKLRIGSGNTDGGGAIQQMTGSIGELIIVSGADATEANRQEVIDYLNAKWSIF